MCVLWKTHWRRSVRALLWMCHQAKLPFWCESYTNSWSTAVILSIFYESCVFSTFREDEPKEPQIRNSLWAYIWRESMYVSFEYSIWKWTCMRCFVDIPYGLGDCNRECSVERLKFSQCVYSRLRAIYRYICSVYVTRNIAAKIPNTRHKTYVHHSSFGFKVKCNVHSNLMHIVATGWKSVASASCLYLFVFGCRVYIYMNFCRCMHYGSVTSGHEMSFYQAVELHRKTHLHTVKYTYFNVGRGIFGEETYCIAASINMWKCGFVG